MTTLLAPHRRTHYYIDLAMPLFLLLASFLQIIHPSNLLLSLFRSFQIIGGQASTVQHFGVSESKNFCIDQALPVFSCQARKKKSILRQAH